MGQTSRHLKLGVNEQLPKCILNFIKQKNKTIAVTQQKDL